MTEQKPTHQKHCGRSNASIIQSQVNGAVRKMKRNKVTGPDEIAVEFIRNLKDFGVEKLTELLNEIYDTRNILNTIIIIPKKVWSQSVT